MDLTIQQLRIVAKIADTQNFTKAAQALDSTQPALSRTVAEVERRLGMVIFRRSTRKVELTEQGHALVGVARQIVAQFDASCAEIAAIAEGARGFVRVATLPSLAAVVLPSAIRRFRGLFPNSEVTVLAGDAAHVHDLIAAGGADLGVTVATTSPGGLQFTPVAQDAFLCITPQGHALSRRRTVSWRELCAETFVAYPPTSSVHPLIQSAFAQCGERPAAVIEAGDISTAGGLVAAGLGVTAAPAFVVRLLAFADLPHQPLIDPVVVRELGILSRRESTTPPAVHAFRTLLVETFKSGAD